MWLFISGDRDEARERWPQRYVPGPNTVLRCGGRRHCLPVSADSGTRERFLEPRKAHAFRYASERKAGTPAATTRAPPGGFGGLCGDDTDRRPAVPAATPD